MKLLLLFVFMAYGTIYSQWVANEYVDEFGDKTGNTYESLIVTGTFTNSATENAKATYVFIKDSDSFTIKVYEYESRLATSADNTYETVKIKQPDNEVVTIENVFFTKTGRLFFKEGDYSELISALSKTGDYTMIFDRDTKYSKSSYRIKFKP